MVSKSPVETAAVRPKSLSDQEGATVVIGAGFLTVDVIQLCRSDWEPINRRPVYASGGTMSNILSYLSVFGWKCGILGAVGEDSLGKVVRADLEQYGIDIAGLYRSNASSTRRILHRIATEGDRLGEHRFDTTCFGCGRRFPAFPDLKPEWFDVHISRMLRQPAILLVDRANDMTIRLAERVTSSGGTVVFEPGYLPRRRDAPVRLMKYVSLLKYSEDLRDGVESVLEEVGTNAARMALRVETRGRRGARIMRGNREIRLTTTPMVNPIDSGGAGDAFMAGLLTGIGVEGLHSLDSVDDKHLEDAVQRGQALGALACLFYGAKGLLHEWSGDLDKIENAIEEVAAFGIPPSDFAHTSVLRGERLSGRAPRQGECRVCRLVGEVG